MLNSFNVMGRLAADPEVKSKGEGEPFTVFRIGNNTGKDETNWINCICFGKTAEMASKYLTKGKLVCLEGRYLQRQYTDKEGNKRESWSMTVRRLHFAEPKPKEAAPVATGSTEFVNEDIPF